MQDNYQTPITADSVRRAENLLKDPADGSVANAQARQMAIAHIIAAAEKFEAFAKFDPSSDVAVYLLGKAAEWRKMICFA